MTETQVGDESRFAAFDASLPSPPDHDDEDIEEADQAEPEEVPDAVLDH
jgi:hypothetical protein